jgi:subtilisin family serine protease
MSSRLPRRQAWFRFLLLLAFAGVLAACTAQRPAATPESPAATRSQGAPAVQLRDFLGRSATDGSARVHEGEKDYDILHIELANPEVCEKFAERVRSTRCHVFSRFGEFADVMVPEADQKRALQELDDIIEDLKRIVAVPLVDYDVGGTARVPPPPRPVPLTGKGRYSGLQDIVRGGVGAIKGRRVIIAVIDSGIDFRHTDFREEKDGKPGSSRLLYFWDTTRRYDPKGPGRPGPLAYRDRQPIGTLFSADDLRKDLQEGKRALGEGDTDGHGTACAGIAGGSGAAGRAASDPQQDYTGVAPEAQLIAVRIVNGHEDIHNDFLLNAVCGWLDAEARARDCPLVVSYSMGGHFGMPDGQRVGELQLSKRFARQPGRLVCIAAGNEGYQPIHAAVRFRKGESALLQWDIDRPALLALHVDGARPEQVQVQPTEGTRVNPGRPRIRPHTGSLEVNVQVLDKGKGGLRLSTGEDKEFQAEAYLPEWVIDKGDIVHAYRFLGSAANPEDQICSPASALGAIAVGSYDFNELFHQGGAYRPMPNYRTGRELVLGALSDYSNFGYLREAARPVVKPDIVAPGRYFTAAAASSGGGRLDDTKRYRLFAGTSAATPYVAGVAALLLQKDRTLTTERFRELLLKYSTKDDSNEKGYPNSRWGRGKLNREAVERLVQALPSP